MSGGLFPFSFLAFFFLLEKLGKKNAHFSSGKKNLGSLFLQLRYGWHFPELAKVVPDNYQYARVALVIKDKAATTAIVSNSSSSSKDDDDDEGGSSAKKKGSAGGPTASEIKEQLADALGGGEDAAARAEEVLAAARSSMGQVRFF